MTSTRRPPLWLCLRQVVSVFGIVSLSVVATLSVQRLLNAPRASAQADQPQVVRASEFDVVGADGAVLARLRGGGQGNGQLMLLDSAGTQRVLLAGLGGLTVNDAGGILRFRAGYTTVVAADGNPPFSGVRLDSQGTVEYLPSTP